MIFTRDAIITAAAISIVGALLYMMALNEQAYETCVETHSADQFFEVRK